MTSVMDAVNPLKRVPPVKFVTPVRPVNHIAFLLDESTSMEWADGRVKQVIAEQLTAIKQAAYGADQTTRVSVFSFTTRYTGAGEALKFRDFAFEEHPEAVQPISVYDPRNGGATPLNDAIREAVRRLELRDQKGTQEAFLLITLTDGQENRSKEGPVNYLIDNLQRAGRWTFAFLVPPGAEMSTSRATGVPVANILAWAQTEEGLRAASGATVIGTQSYMSARSRGETQTSAFYTDASKLKPSVVAKKLEDVSKDFRHWRVDAEQPISNFVKEKTGSYELGRAFYELTKPEMIQSHKDIVLQNRKTKKFFGGEEARTMLGIAKGPGVNVRVRPGNHGDWKIFVKSTSMNRKLVRGTDLLYQK